MSFLLIYNEYRLSSALCESKLPHSAFNLIGLVACAEAGAAHHAQQALRVKDGRAVGLELVADGAELVQRAADLSLVVDYHLQRAALGVYKDAVIDTN